MSASVIPAHSATQAKARLGAVTGQAAGSHLRLVSAGELQQAVDIEPAQSAQPRSILDSAIVAPTRRELLARRLATWRARLGRLAVIQSVVVGGILEVMDGLREFLAPLHFCLRHSLQIAMGALTVTVPAMLALALWLRVPGWFEGFPIASPLTWAFLAGLSVAIGFVVATAVVALRALLTGIQLATRHLRRKGQTAFE